MPSLRSSSLLRPLTALALASSLFAACAGGGTADDGTGGAERAGPAPVGRTELAARRPAVAAAAVPRAPVAMARAVRPPREAPPEPAGSSPPAARRAPAEPPAEARLARGAPPPPAAGLAERAPAGPRRPAERPARAATGGTPGSGVCGGGTAQSSDITINEASLQQKITGFGVSSAWAGSYANASDPDYLWSTTTGAGLSLLRIRYGDGLAIAQAAAKAGVTVWLTPWGTGTNGAPGGADTTTQANANGCKVSVPVLTNPQEWANTLASYVQKRSLRGCRSTRSPPRTSRTAAGSTRRRRTRRPNWPPG